VIRFLTCQTCITPYQFNKLQQVNQDVAELTHHAQEIAKILVAAYGLEDPRAVRAQEISDAIQRLQWAMERKANAAST
jgi:hypothetical protein